MLAVAIALWVRLDASALSEHVATDIARLTRASLKAEQTSLSFMHGLGLRMEGISLQHPEVSMQAGHININVRLLPLLLGKIEIATLDIHDARFRVRSGLLDQASLAGIAALPANRIRLVRAHLEDADGGRILQDVSLDVRNIGPERETLWEFQGQQDEQSLNGHGSLNFHHGEIDSGFGKLKFENIPVTWLSAFAHESLRSWFGDPAYRLGGALTLGLKNGRSWSVFGDARVSDADNQKIFSLRGKLHHPDVDQYFWDDSFIHLGDKAVITTKGQCFQLECNASVAAKQLPLKALAALLPNPGRSLRMLEGNSEINASLKWKKGQWEATGDLLLRDGKYHYRQISSPLPELFFDQASISGDLKHWRATSALSIPKMYGKLAIESSSEASGRTTLRLETDGIEKFPQSLLDMLLAAANVELGLQARGKLAGSMKLDQDANGSRMELAFNADQAFIALPGWLEKQAGVPAQCHLLFDWPGKGAFNPTSTKMDQCRLDTSTVGKAAWRHQDQRYEIDAHNLDIDLDSLKRSFVRLPEEVQGMQGRLLGDISSSRSDTDNKGWLEAANGTLLLESFGTAAWQGSGKLNLDKGAISSAGLHASGMFGQAELQGSYNVADRQGGINILAGELDWGSLPQLPESWQEISLAGKIKDGRLKLLNNELSRIESRYQLQQGELKLEEFSSELADGLVYSPSFSLMPNAAGLAVSGNLRCENVQLNQLAGLNQWLQAEVSGKLHTNLELHGQLPIGEMAEWQRSNGDILIYNGRWQQNNADSLKGRLGINKKVGKPARFSKLSFRFRLQESLVDISRIKLQQREDQYSGVASIKKNQHIHGLVKENNGEGIYALDGVWPTLSWQQIQ